MRSQSAFASLCAILFGLVLCPGACPAAAGVVPGDPAPAFTLTDTEGRTHVLADYLKDGKIVVLEWFNPDCPFIQKHHLKHKTMDQTFAAVKDKGVVWLAINSGAEGKQGAGLERNRRAVKDFAMTIPVLLDPQGTVGRSYGAKTTPHMFIVTPAGVVAYAGGIDDDRSADALGKTNYAAQALGELLAGKAVSVVESQPYGCSVKYGEQPAQ